MSRRLFEQFGRSVDEAARTGQEPDASSAGPSPLRMATGAVLDALRSAVLRIRARVRDRARARPSSGDGVR